jgi:peptidoglycan L-alanyl-D-glutamate endopeptidase CwlK
MSKYNYGRGSEAKMSTVKPRLRAVCERALGYGVMDASVIQGVRSRVEQDRYYGTGKSKVKWPNGKHNIEVLGDLASAVDIAPYINGTVSWRKDHCCVWAGLMLAAAKEEGVILRWGGNWDMDGEPITDQDFQDLVHFELND